MALAIRLARGGMKKRPYYRIVVTDSRNARDGKFIEKIGTYNPLLAKDNPERVKLDGERAKHWLRSARSRPTASPASSTPPACAPARRAATRTRACPATRPRSAPTPRAAKQAELDEAAAAEAAEAAEAVEPPRRREPSPKLPSRAGRGGDRRALPADDAKPADAPVDAATETDASPAGPAV